MAADTVVLGIIIGTLAAIVYSLRVLILLERRIARMDLNIESLTRKVLSEEIKLESEEKILEKELKPRRTVKKTTKKTTKRKTSKKKKR